MTQFNDDDENRSAERMDNIVDAIEEAEKSAVAKSELNETTSINFDYNEVQDISEEWPSAEKAVKVGKEPVEKTDQPEPERTIRRRNGEFSLEDNSGDLMDNLDQVEDKKYWETLGEVNDTLRQLENNRGLKKLSLYSKGDHNPEDLRFEGFTSGLGKIVENYVTELANEVDQSGGQYEFMQDSGAVKTAIGYTLGASPDGEAKGYDSFEEVPEDILEGIGDVISTITESAVHEDQKQGKYIEAFKLYGETDMSQREIARQSEIDEGSLSRRKSQWQEAGLIEGDEYTEAGETLVEMVDEVYSAK